MVILSALVEQPPFSTVTNTSVVAVKLVVSVLTVCVMILPGPKLNVYVVVPTAPGPSVT